MLEEGIGDEACGEFGQEPCGAAGECRYDDRLNPECLATNEDDLWKAAPMQTRSIHAHFMSIEACSVVIANETIGNILKAQSFEVAVSSEDTNLSMTGGVALELQALGTAKSQSPSTSDEVRSFAPASFGSIVVTGAGLLPVRHVFHTIVVDWEHGVRPNERTIRHLGREISSKLNGGR